MTAPASTPPTRERSTAPRVRPVRLGPVSMLVRPRALAVSAVLLVLVTIVAFVHLATGTTQIDPVELLRTLVGLGTDPSTTLVVQGIRGPRVVAAIVAGIALGVAGAITQTLARNPLASPDVLGVTNTAALGAVAVLVIAGGAHGGASGLAAAIGMPAAALIGGLAAGVLTAVLGWRGGVDLHRTVLVGIGVSWLATSLTTWLLTLGDVTNAAIAVTWMSGSLNGREWTSLLPSVIAILVVLAFTAAISHAIPDLAFDDATAVGLGVRLARLRLAALAGSVALGSLAALVVGPISFVALAAPQIARLATRSTTPPLLASGAVGAMLLLVADVVMSKLFPIPLPAGVGTALVGVPYLVWLLIVSRNRPTRA